MSTRRWILWIDDVPSRRTWADKLEAVTKGTKVLFECVKDVEIDEVVLPHLAKKTKPRLVIIDHILDKVAPGGLGISRGSTVAGMLRETWQECPMIGLTAHVNVPDIEVDRFVYDELVDQNRLSEYLAFVPALITGFGTCGRVTTLRGLLKLFGTPKSDTERLSRCLPHEIKQGVTEMRRRFASMVYQWFRQKLYGLPGLLYDGMWAATQLGIKDRCLRKYIAKLANAEYRGIFRNPNDRRWWKSRLLEEIYSRSTSKVPTMHTPQRIAAEVLKVAKSDYSVCYACQEPWPETVGYVDESEGAVRKQLHLRCTVAHSLYSYEPMFEEPRVMGK